MVVKAVINEDGEKKIVPKIEFKIENRNIHTHFSSLRECNQQSDQL